MAEIVWRPIETHDGSTDPVLLWCPSVDQTPGYWIVGVYGVRDRAKPDWCSHYEGEDILPPSHWAPLTRPDAELIALRAYAGLPLDGSDP